MNLIFNQKNLGVLCFFFLAATVFAADTNDFPNLTRAEMTNDFLKMEERLNATQLALEQDQQIALAANKNNAEALAAQFQSLERTVILQHQGDAEVTHRTQLWVLLVAGAFGLGGLGIMLLIYFQGRAFAQFAQVSTQQHSLNGNGHGVHQIAAAGRATVENANTRFLDAVGQLEKRIDKLEVDQPLLPPTTNGHRNGQPAKPVPTEALTEGQKYLDTDSPQKALDFFENFLAAHPGNANAILKKAEALEKLGRTEEALTHYNRAIAADNTLAIAHLHKGGLLNRLRRYDEALNCYEQALLAQDRKATAKAS